MKSQIQMSSATPTLSASEKPTPTRTGQWHQIALLAYSKAESRGFTPGHELDDWLEAERELAEEYIDEVLAA